MEDIEKSKADEREKRHNFLRQWKRMKGSVATYKNLVSALLEINSIEDAEKVCIILKQSGVSSGEKSKIVPSNLYVLYCFSMLYKVLLNDVFQWLWIQTHSLTWSSNLMMS